jgi:biopolymer transport protein ExbD
MRRKSQQVIDEIEDPSINLTPLIDVVFVILIMFIVVAPLLEVDEVSLATGNPENQEMRSLQKQHPVSIYVRADNSIWFDNRLVNLESLTPLLEGARSRHLDAVPMVFHDKKAHFGTYQSVKGAVEQAGFSKMEVVLRPG